MVNVGVGEALPPRYIWAVGGGAACGGEFPDKVGGGGVLLHEALWEEGDETLRGKVGEGGVHGVSTLGYLSFYLERVEGVVRCKRDGQAVDQVT